MSKIVLYPANGFDFDAADVAAYLAGLTSGVFSGAEDFPVTAAGGLTVIVGFCFDTVSKESCTMNLGICRRCTSNVCGR